MSQFAGIEFGRIRIIGKQKANYRDTKRLVSVDICSVEGKSAGIFVSKVLPGMLIGTHQKLAVAENLVIDINSTRLEIVNDFKYLGVLLDPTLSWKDHVEYIDNKVSSRLGMLRRARKVLPKATCLMLYNTLVLPLFDYCSSVWDSCGSGSKVYLGRLNQRVACIIEGRTIGADDLKSTLSWPSLQARREYL